MKKLFLAISLLALAACAKTDAPVTKDTGTPAEKFHFHGVARVDETRGVAQMDKLWHPGTTILVKFLNGTTADQTLVKEVAAEWEQHANIKFRFVDSGNAPVRIHFDEDYMRWVTWSYTGTDCKFITDQAEPTAFFACWDGMSAAEKITESRRVFGQILGLELEHRHLDFEPNFRTTIKNYWGGVLPDIVWEELCKYVLDPLENMNVPENIVQTREFDEGSIMVWPFLSRMYVGNSLYPLFGNDQLSQQDIVFIGQLYPKPQSEELPYLMMIVMNSGATEENASFPYFYGNKDIMVDYGNSGFTWVGPAVQAHVEPVVMPGYDIYIRGENDAISGLQASGNHNIYSIDILGNAEIKNVCLSNIYGFGAHDNPFIEVLCLDLNSSWYGYVALGMPSLHTLDLEFDDTPYFSHPAVFPSLQRISIKAPIVDDEDLMINFVNALADRTGLSPGYYYLSSERNSYVAPAQTVLNILASKNWVLGASDYKSYLPF